MDDEDQEALERTAVDLVRTAARFSRTAGRVPGTVYSSVAWRVIAELELTGPARVSDLAQQQRVAQPSMTSLVHRLEGEGWVVREPDPSDGRAALVHVTPSGVEALTAYRRAAAERVVPLLAGLDASDRAILDRAIELLEQLSDLD
jgi:DNA-binding MarR family transcriptional regulator